MGIGLNDQDPGNVVVPYFGGTSQAQFVIKRLIQIAAEKARGDNRAINYM